MMLGRVFLHHGIISLVKKNPSQQNSMIIHFSYLLWCLRLLLLLSAQVHSFFQQLMIWPLLKFQHLSDRLVLFFQPHDTFFIGINNSFDCGLGALMNYYQMQCRHLDSNPYLNNEATGQTC